MSSISVGDLSQAYRLRTGNRDLKQTMATLSEEMTSGRKKDLAGATGGDLTALASITHALNALDAYKIATNEGTLFAGATQGALETARTLAGDASATLLNAATARSDTYVDTAAAAASQNFGAAVAALNVRVADRYVLAGAAVDQRPLADAATMLSDLAGVVAGLTTAGDIEAAVTAWFDAAPGGGGFLDSAYGGATGTATRFALAPGDSTSIDITAADPGIRSLLKGFALGALLTQGVLGGDTAARAALAGAAGAELVAAGNRVLDLQTGLGTVEARLSDAAARNANEAAALKVARSSIIAADPYETATALQEAQTRMETLYTLTAHLSQLSLADYLR